MQGRQSPEYLLRWVNGTPLDDTWVPSHDASFDLEPYFVAFHHKYPSLLIPKLLRRSEKNLGYHAGMAV